MTIPSAVDLLATIRGTVVAWANLYLDESGHAVSPVYLSSLANDIAFELGILEAAQAIEVAKPSRREAGSTEGESAVGDSRCAQPPASKDQP